MLCCAFQRSCVWSSPGQSKPATRKLLHSTRPCWLDRKRRWRYSCRKKTTQMGKSGEEVEKRLAAQGYSRSLLWPLCLPGFTRVPCLCCSLSVVVEDVSSSCCVTVKVFPYMTVAALKQQVRNLLVTTAGNVADLKFALTDFLLLSSSSSSGISRVRFPSSRPALGDRSVFVHRAEVISFLRGAEGWRYSVPILDLCPASPDYPPAVPAGPGECPTHHTSPPRQRAHLPGLEGLQHPPFKASPQQPGWVQGTLRWWCFGCICSALLRSC